MKKPDLYLLAALAALAVGAATGAEAGAIKKCQDARGRWHYGDTADAACAESRVIVIDDQGVKKDEIAAPPTEEEIAQQAEAEKAEERSKEQAKRDELLLSTYAHEDDITYIRDRKLTQLEAAIQASRDTLKPLRATLERLEQQAAQEREADGDVSERTTEALRRTRAQIDKHEAAIERRREEQEMVRAQARRDLKRYRELKSRSGKGADAER